MAPPPEYDKEPKAPDKSATNISCEETKTVHNLVNDQPTNSDNKSASTTTNAEAENNKLVETLDDGQLRALLDEAITYKCPKDREGKSNLFKELLEEVEQDEQASEAAARGAGAGGAAVRAARAPPRPARNRRALPHSNSLQDLVAALAAEPPRRHRPAPSAAPASSVSARAIHGGSLPSGVDTSFLLGEEPMGGGYLATVRCVNPPPLNERRVSATDANAAAEVEMLTRRSKPATFPMTYTARATLEIGAPPAARASAPTTTTPSNQVPYPPPAPRRPRRNTPQRLRTTAGLTPSYKRLNVTTSDPSWEFMRALNAPNIKVTGGPKITTQKAKSKRNKNKSRMQKAKSEQIPIRKENSGVTNAKVAESLMHPSNKNHGLSKPSLPKMKYKQRKTSEIKNVPPACLMGPQIIFTETIKDPKKDTPQSFEKHQRKDIHKAQGAKINAPQNFEKRQQKYHVEGNRTVPIEIPQRSNYSYFDRPQQKLLYSYRLSPTVGPPERLYTQKLYNPYRRRFTRKNRYIQGEPENENVILENYNESLSSESNYATANTKLELTLTDNTDLNSTLENDSTELNISLPDDDIDIKQFKLLSALFPKKTCDRENGGGRKDEAKNDEAKIKDNTETRGRAENTQKDIEELQNKKEEKDVKQDKKEAKGVLQYKKEEKSAVQDKGALQNKNGEKAALQDRKEEKGSLQEESKWSDNINNWYKSLEKYAPVPVLYGENRNDGSRNLQKGNTVKCPQFANMTPRVPQDIIYNGIAQRFAPKDDRFKWTDFYPKPKEDTVTFPLKSSNHMKRNAQKSKREGKVENVKYDSYQDRSHYEKDNYFYRHYSHENYNSYIETVDENTHLERQKYRKRVGKTLSHPDVDINPRNIRKMTIGKPLPEMDSNYIAVSEDKSVTESDENTLSVDNKIEPNTGFINSSSNRNEVVAELEKVDAVGDIITNTSARSSTPIIELNDIVEAENHAKNTGVVKVETGPKESPLENVEDDKGTVHIPIVSQTNYVTIDVDDGLPNDFSSFSQDKDERRGANVELVAKEKEENSIKLKNVSRFTSKPSLETIHEIELTDLSASRDCEEHALQNVHELVDIQFHGPEDNTSFSKYLAEQRQLFQALEDSNLVDSAHEHSLVSNLDNSEKVQFAKDKLSECVSETIQDDHVEESLCELSEPTNSEEECLNTETTKPSKDVVMRLVQVQFAKDKLSECVSETIQDDHVEESLCELSEPLNSEEECLNTETTKPSKDVVMRLVQVQFAKDQLSECVSETIQDDHVEESLCELSEPTNSEEECLNTETTKPSKDVVMRLVQVQFAKDQLSECVSETIQDDHVEESLCELSEPTNSEEECLNTETTKPSKDVVMRLDESALERASEEKCIREELPNNASFVFLTLPQTLLAHLSYNIDATNRPQIEHSNRNHKSKKKKDPAVDYYKKRVLMHKNAVRALLFEKISKRDSADKSKNKRMSTVTIKEVDSTIPFSCITTPEVVASCNTTSSTAQSAVAVDPKPVQLGWCYVGAAGTGDPPAHPAPRPHGLACLCCRPPTLSPPRSVVSSSFNGLPLSRPNYGSTASTTQDEFKKSLDENGNSVQGYSSPLSGSSQHKKPRRKKSSKNETVIKSHQIDGYQGNKDLNEVLRFIESNAESTRAGKLGRTKHKDDSDDKSGKKRSTERRKDKESKMKRATSMEELSRTKLEDLTDKPGKKERRNDTAPKAERRSWGDDARDSFYYHETEPQDADFQTVTKKRKPRRRADDTTELAETGEAASGDPARPTRPQEPRARRVSAPPSDRSADSNDDMDSVHSLPADAPKAASTHAPVSYADIARTRHNIPDLIESCNFYAEGEVRADRLETVAVTTIDADGYPALEPRVPRRHTQPVPLSHATPLPHPLPHPLAHPHTQTTPNCVSVAPPAHKHPPATTTVRHSRKAERVDCQTGIGVTGTAVVAGGRGGGGGSAPPPTPAPAPDVVGVGVGAGRPAVILLDSARPHDMDGVTFGFDINEQLLGGPTRRPRCDLVRDAIEVATVSPSDINGAPPASAEREPESPPEPEPSGAHTSPDPLLGVAVAIGCAALRYVAPRPPADTTHLHQIIDYVGAAWEDVVRCGSGKVRYFNE